MTDHRRVQRTLFRMQLDRAFAAALRSGEVAAVASTRLDARDLALLSGANPAGVEADHGGRRRQQFLGNVTSEFVATTWLALPGGADPQMLETFTSSQEFHDAVASDGALPLAFADHAARRAGASHHASLGGFVTVESAMASARRAAWERAAPGPGEIVLTSRARTLRVPAGTFERLAAVRAALEARREPALRAPSGTDAEETLLLTTPSGSAVRRLPDVDVEPLSGSVAALLVLAEEPVGHAELAALAQREDAVPAELTAFIESLVADEVLQRG